MSEHKENVVPADDGGEQNVDKIREILFGANMREYEQRFANLEQRLIAENEKLGEFIEKRLTGIATATQRELAGLAARIEDQQRALASLDEASRGELDGLNHQLNERLADLQDAVGKEALTLRNDFTEQHNDLVGLVKRTRQALSEGLQQESDKLEVSKVSREDLSALLAELSGRLGHKGGEGGT